MINVGNGLSHDGDLDLFFCFVCFCFLFFFLLFRFVFFCWGWRVLCLRCSVARCASVRFFACVWGGGGPVSARNVVLVNG